MRTSVVVNCQLAVAWSLLYAFLVAHFRLKCNRAEFSSGSDESEFDSLPGSFCICAGAKVQGFRLLREFDFNLSILSGCDFFEGQVFLAIRVTSSVHGRRCSEDDCNARRDCSLCESWYTEHGLTPLIERPR